MEKATRQQIKAQNRDFVLKFIFDHPSTSRAEIARITHLTRTTVSDIVADLIAEELVEEVGTGSSIGGKSPILLSLKDNSRYLIGLDLAYNKFCGAIVNLRGKIHQMVSHPINGQDSQGALQATYSILDQLVKAAPMPLIGIGVGAPGLVNTKDGVVINAVNLDWKNLPLGQYLRERYHLPAFVINDCQAAAMGEFVYGNDTPSVQNMIVIRAGHGIGSGIILNGKIYQGDGGGAGEIGHAVVVRDNGLPCRCGNFGCLETVASARSVLQRAEMLAQIPNRPMLTDYSGAITLDALRQAFLKGDVLARQIVLDAGRYLGMAIASMIGALNIHKIVLTGEMTCFGQPWLEAIQETIRQNTLAKLVQETDVQIGRLMDDDVILGATALLASDYTLLIHRK